MSVDCALTTLIESQRPALSKTVARQILLIFMIVALDSGVTSEAGKLSRKNIRFAATSAKIAALPPHSAVRILSIRFREAEPRILWRHAARKPQVTALCGGKAAILVS